MSRTDIFSHAIFRGLSNAEQIRLLAEAFHYTLQKQDDIRTCDEPECGVRIPRGVRCQVHLRSRRAAFERARYAKRKGRTAETEQEAC